MSRKTLTVLVGISFILVFLWMVSLYRQVPHSQSPFAKAVDQATGICLMRAGSGVQLNKAGMTWSVHAVSGPELNAVESSGVWPAEIETVKTLLSGLKDVQLEDVISDRADRQADFEVDHSSGLRVVLMGKSAALADGVFGKQAPDFAHIYFKYSDRPNIYLARGLIRGELGGPELNRWRSRQLIDIPETKIHAITMEGPGFKTELVRTSTETWTLDGKKVETGLVNALVGTLAHLRFNEFIDPAADPKLTFDRLTYGRVLIKSADASVELKIGAQDPKSKQYPVSTGQSMGLAWLPESLIHSLQQKPSAFTVKK